MTDAERKLWWHLRGLKVGDSHFRRQATIGPYYADFACHECKLIIELDGSGHMAPDRLTADNRRTKFLQSQGYRVLRFWNTDVLKEIDGVMTAIHEATQNGPPPLTPPHHAQGRVGGGESKVEE